MEFRFVCEPFPIVGDPQEFYAKELGTCIPLGTVESYQDKDSHTLTLVARYLSKHPPHLTALYYDTLAARQPSVSVSVESLPVHTHEWIDHINTLTGSDNVCFISDWNLLPKDVMNILPESYSGEVIPRGTSGCVPVLLEWTQELLGPDNKGILGFSKIWNFGTWGYVLPISARPLVEQWTTLTTVSEAQVEEFFQNMQLMFFVKFDLDGIWVVSHTLDPATIGSMLDRPDH